MKKINILKNIAVGLIMVIMGNITLFFIAQAKEPNDSANQHGLGPVFCSTEMTQEILTLPKSSRVIDCDAYGMHCISINGSATNGLSCDSTNNNN